MASTLSIIAFNEFSLPFTTTFRMKTKRTEKAVLIGKHLGFGFDIQDTAQIYSNTTPNEAMPDESERFLLIITISHKIPKDYRKILVKKHTVRELMKS